MLKVIDDGEPKGEINISSLPLKRIHLDYSIKVIEYVRIKRIADVKNLYDFLSKRKIPQEYKLSVYYNNAENLYHVYGQEPCSFGNAFILGALLLDKSFTLSNNKIAITGVIHKDDTDKRKLELSNLNELFGGYFFKIDIENGDIIPVYSLEGRLLKNIHKQGTCSVYADKCNKPIIKQVKHEFRVDKNHVIQKRYPLPPLGCPEGFLNCISNCNYYIKEPKDNNRCGFICKLGNDLHDCNELCPGYLKLSNNTHCCRYEFTTSCEYNIHKKEK